MSMSREDLRWAADQGLLAPGQDETLWRALEQRHAGKPRFDVANVAYYAGALIVIGAMGWYLTRAWESFGGPGIAAVAMGYAVCFVLAGRVLWDRLGLRVPGGLLFTMAVGMTPLFTYGVLRAFELWPQDDPGAYQGFHFWIKGSWFTLEIATILAGLIALRFRRFPFLTAPIAVALWYLSMDLFPLLMGVGDHDWEARKWISLCFGLAMLVGAYAVDLRGRDEDFAFWIYLFGLLAFWGGLSLMDSGSELGKFLYALINLGLIVISLILRRRVFVLFGALGVTGYIGHLAYRVFEDSVLFPFALTFLGLAIIALGVIYQRNRGQLEQFLFTRLPAGWLAFLPPRVRPPAAGTG
jgi:hypothetical protein